jgi:hypothetical protein
VTASKGGGVVAHLSDTELAGYLDQDLSAGARRRIEGHLDQCDECRAELIAVTRILAEGWDREAEPVRPVRPVRRGWRVPAGIAGLAAAAALAVILLGPQDRPARDDSGRERVVAEGVGELAVRAPADDAVVRVEGLRFVWGDHGTGSYRITVTAEDGALIWWHTLPDTVVAAPPDMELEPGRYFWYVDAVEAGVVARTRVRSFTVAP